MKLKAGSITTLTYFDGALPWSALLARVDALLRHSPWLAGRLVESKEGEASLSVPEAIDHEAIAACLSLVPTLSADVGADLDAHFVPSGHVCLEQQLPLFRVLAARTARGFALAVSLSHVMCDGYTYYKVFGALGGSGVALDTQRVHNWEASVPEVIGEDCYAWLKSQERKAGKKAVLQSGSPVQHGSWRVPTGWIEEQKQQHDSETTGVPFVSTNDIITSWFLRGGGYEIGGAININVRGRVEGVEARHAGCYESVVHLWPEDYATAADVRMALQRTPLGSARSDVPSPDASARGHLGMVTNWASLQEELSLPGCRHVEHVPVFRTSHPYQDLLVIWKPTPDALAVGIAARTDLGAWRELGEWEPL